MCILTDTSIEKILTQNKNAVPIDDKLNLYPYSEDFLTPIGYDLRIGNEYSVSSKANINILKPGEVFKIKPGETVLVPTLEKITMPKNRIISGIILSKVSITTKDLSTDATTIDPDWNGTLLLVIHNNSQKAVELKQGDAICTFICLKNADPSTRMCKIDDKRNSLLINNWNQLNSRTNKKEFLYSILAPLIIIISFIIGNHYFSNNSGLVATVAVGVALSNLINKWK